MPRTIHQAVVGILLDDYDGTSSLIPFIQTANVLVNRMLTCAASRGVTFSSEELELIERWLAAHYYTRSNQVASHDKTDDSEVWYQGRTDMGLESSNYGQTAMTLDVSGCLRLITKRKVVSLTWLGKHENDQISYEDRNGV